MRLMDLFWRVSLGGAYSSSLETKLAHDIKRVDAILNGDQPFYGEPLRVDADFVWENGRFGTGRAFVRAILCLLASQSPESFSDGSKVVLDNAWLIQANSKNYHHFFPRAYLRKQGLEEWEINNVANITIIDADHNKRLIRDKAPGTYMKQFKDNSRLRQTMRTHLINLESDGVWDNDYRRFARARCRAIARELNKRLITPDDAAPDE